PSGGSITSDVRLQRLTRVGPASTQNLLYSWPRIPFSCSGASFLISGNAMSASASSAAWFRFMNASTLAVTSWSVKTSRLANSLGRSIGVAVSTVCHLPCRSGSPHAVRVVPEPPDRAAVGAWAAKGRAGHEKTATIPARATARAPYLIAPPPVSAGRLLAQSPIEILFHEVHAFH